MRPSDDIRRYCANATLEPLATTCDYSLLSFSYPEHSSVSREAGRPLLQVRKLSENFFQLNVQQYPFPIQSFLHREDIDAYDDKCTIAVFPDGLVSVKLPHPVSNLAGVSEWVKQSLLVTSESVLNILDYGSSKWFFFEWYQDRVFSAHLLQKLHQGFLQPTLAVFVVPPWVITLDLFRSLVDVEVVRDLRSATRLRARLGDCCDLSPPELLWCEIYDRCMDMSVTRFVLTSYDYWVFGHLSQDSGSCFATITPVMHPRSSGPTLLQAIVFHVRPTEYRDIGLSSQVSTASSWVSGDTARPLKRKTPPGSDRPRELRAPHFKTLSSRSSTGSGPHRRSRRAPSVVSSHKSRSRNSRSVGEVADPTHFCGRPPSPMLHSVKEECIDGDSSGREGPPPSPSANSPALRDEQSEVMDETPDGAAVPESQPLSFPSSLEPTTPIREDPHPNGIPSPPPHTRPSGPSLAYISTYPPSPSPLPHLQSQQMPEYPPAPTVQLVESEGSDRGRSPTPIQNLTFPEWCRVSSPLVSPPPTPPPASQEFHWPETTSEHLTWGDDWVQQDSQYAVGVQVAPQPFRSRTPIDCSDSQAVDYGYYGSDNDVEPVLGVELVPMADDHAHNPVVLVEGLRSQSMSSQDESSSADNPENDEPVFTPPSRPLSEYSVDDPSGGTQFTPDSIPDSLSFKSEFSASDARKKALEKYREACRELGHLLERMRRRDIVYPEDDLEHLSNQHETDSNHFSPVSDENSAPESPRPLSDELAESLCSSARTMSTSRALEIREVVRATLGHRDPDPLPPSST